MQNVNNLLLMDLRTQKKLQIVHVLHVSCKFILSANREMKFVLGKMEKIPPLLSRNMLKYPFAIESRGVDLFSFVHFKCFCFSTKLRALIDELFLASTFSHALQWMKFMLSTSIRKAMLLLSWFPRNTQCFECSEFLSIVALK
jgi:hypothetical protein